MNTKRMIFSVIAVFIFIFASDFLIHGKLLSEMYMQTASLWRGEQEIASMRPWMLSGQFLVSLFLGLLLIRMYRGGGCSEGLNSGLLLGLLMVGPNLIMYAVAPYPFEMVLAWIVGNILQFAIAGLIVAAIYRPA
jgi:hypothetical protein